MAITILAQDVLDGATDGTSQTLSFAVPGGTSRLIVGVQWRGQSSGTAPAISSVTYNGDAVTQAITNAAGGYNDHNTWWGDRASPDVGTANIVITWPSTARGCKCWALAISGEKATGSIWGTSATQRVATSATDTVSLGVTPAASGDSLLLASLGISTPTTLTTWTGSGFTEAETGGYSPLDTLTATSRYKLNASGTTTVSAKFGASTVDIGGSLVEILAEPTGTDVSGSFETTLAVTGSTGEADTARIADVSYRNGAAAQTEVLFVQPDNAGVTRRLLSLGPDGNSYYILDQRATGTAANNIWHWAYRTSAGVVTLQSGAGTQSTSAKMIALVHSPDDSKLFVGSANSISSIVNGGLGGVLDLGTGGEYVGGHEGASPEAYLGLVGRSMVYDGELSSAQLRLMALAEEDPDSIWGYGLEDDARDANQSPVACPREETLDGQPEFIIEPRIVDPSGGTLTITGVTQPTNGTIAISGLRLIYRPTRGWTGTDSVTYTVSDGSKTSTAKISIRQTRPALKANGDSITVTAGSSVTFNPLANDVGAGTLRVTTVSTPGTGTVSILADGRIRYTAAP